MSEQRIVRMATYQYGHYSEVQAERDIQGDNFSRGVINFKFDVPNNARWKPSMSFFKVRIKLTRANGDMLQTQD